MKCAKPGCNHYTQGRSKLSFPMLKNQPAECNRCHEPFILNKRALRMESPCCDSCVKRKPSEKEKAANEFFEELESGLTK